LLPVLIDGCNALGIDLCCASENGCDLHGVMIPWRSFIFLLTTLIPFQPIW
jgi:hypothetical protein